MEAQSFKNHHQYVTGFHFILFGVLVLTLVGAIINLVKCWGNHQTLYSASLIVVIDACVIMVALYGRIFALKAQDRAIRAEENLRHFAMTGKLLDARLTVRQIIGLRFASDGEFVELAKQAADQGLSEDAIKQAVKNWRADTHRV
ncbi:MAG: DUF6526 family protein [Candidatus Zixiibacteriota bacterium]